MSSGTKISLILALIFLGIVGGYFMLLPEQDGIVPTEPGPANEDLSFEQQALAEQTPEYDYFDMAGTAEIPNHNPPLLTVPGQLGDSGNSPTDPNWPPSSQIDTHRDSESLNPKGGGIFIVAEDDHIGLDQSNDDSLDDSWLTQENPIVDPDPKETTLRPASNKPITIGNDDASPEFVEYKVQKGDSFWTIAKAWLGDGSKSHLIQAANPNVDPARMQIGQVLRLPAKESNRPLANDDRKQSNQQPKTVPANAKLHTVDKGDTLSSIAQEYYGKASKWQVIYETNEDLIGPDPARLKLGQQLIIPVG